MKAMESRHNMEMNRIKQINESSDRLKRERWMDQKAKKIKDQTVRSLESEVQKIMNRLDDYNRNIAKGTTDPRVEFILPK